jgi:hypothetical protein
MIKVKSVIDIFLSLHFIKSLSSSYLIFDITSLCLIHCLDTPGHALNQISTNISWNLVPLLLHPFLKLLDPFRGLLIAV